MKQEKKYKGWKDELQQIIDANNGTRVNGKVTSHKTRQERAKCLFKFFNDLRESGYAVSPTNIKLKHIEFICKQYESQNLSAATIQTYIMHLRVYCRWIGKDGMIKDVDQYFTEPEKIKRTYAAQRDKSWTGNGINVIEKLNEIKQSDPYVWIQLLMESAFGLRRKEAISLRPYIHFVDESLHIIDGAKGGKTRIIPVETELQKKAREEAKNFVGKTSNRLSHPHLTLPQELSKYSRVMIKHGLTQKELGVTGHGLRHEFIHNFMLSMGLVPSVKGEVEGRSELTPEQEMEIRLKASQISGHNRVNITTAYSGAPVKKKK